MVMRQGRPTTTYFHGQYNRVDHNQREDGVFERWRCDEPPDLQLHFLLRNVALDGFGFESEFDAFALETIGDPFTVGFIVGKAYLILVQFAVAIFLFTFVLKGHDDETNEDIHHEESDDLLQDSVATCEVSVGQR